MKAEKTLRLNDGWVKLYAKPGIVRVESDSGVKITGLREVESLKSGTFGRLEGGASAELSEAWSVYGAIAHTFGSDYSALSFNAGLNYSF